MQTVKEKIMTTVSDLIEGPDRNQTCYEILDFVEGPNSGRLHIVKKRTGQVEFMTDYSICRESVMFWNAGPVGADTADSIEIVFAKVDIKSVWDWFIDHVSAPNLDDRNAEPRTPPQSFSEMTPAENGRIAARNDDIVTVHELPGGFYGINLNAVPIAEFMPGNRQTEFVRTFLESNKLYPDTQSQESFPWLAD